VDKRLQSSRERLKKAEKERAEARKEDNQTTNIPDKTVGLKPSDLPEVAEKVAVKTAFGFQPAKKTSASPYVSPQTSQQEQIDAARMPSGRQAQQSAPFEDVRSSTFAVTQTLSKTGQFTKLNPNEWQQVKNAVNAGVQAQQAASTASATDTQIANQVKQAVQNQVKAEQKAATRTKTLTQTQVKVITKAITKTLPKPPVKKPPVKKPPVKKPPMKIPLPLPKSSPEEKSKRQAIIKAGGAIAWPQGELNGVKVWHVIKHPYTTKDHLVVMGAGPEGAELKPGAKEAYNSLRVLWGQGPSKAVRYEGGAVDPIVSGDKDRATITFVKDITNNKRRKPGRPPKYSPPKRRDDIGGGVVETSSGRRHIKR